MANIVTTSTIKFTDLFDVTPVQSYIAASGPLTQTYDKAHASYAPDFKTTPLVLEFKVLRAGTTEALNEGLSAVTWIYESQGNSEVITPATTGFSLSGSAGETLAITSNIPVDSAGLNIRAIATFIDAKQGNTSAQLVNQLTISLTNSATTPVTVNVYSDTGLIFMNSQPGSVRIKADVYEDGNSSQSSRSFAWFRQDTSVVTTSNPLYDSRVGLGWAKVTNTSNTVQSSTGFDSPVTTDNVLTILEEDVVSVETYQLIVTIQSGSRKGESHRSFQTVYTYDNPITVVITTSAGTMFKNGQGSTDLTATLFKSSGEVDSDGSVYTYHWYYYKTSGELDPSFGTDNNPYRSGKTITVPASLVPESARLVVEVSA